MSNPDRALHLSGFYLVLLVNSNDTVSLGHIHTNQTEQKRTEQQKGINKETIRKRAR